jgi:hypothetical protein
MELIVRERIYPESKRSIPPPKLPVYLRAALILSAAFTVVSLGARAVAQYAQPPPNPLITFADMLPGKSGNGMEARGFSCYSESYDYRATQLHCFVDLPTGNFIRIGLLISQDWVIQSASFTMRGNMLRLGDLMLTLGRAQVSRYGGQTIFNWPGTGITASSFANGAPRSPLLPLWSVSFTLQSASI